MKYRSVEEGQMRDLVVPRLRKLWPDARIIHELPLRYSERRIDLAAVTPDKIIAVEIKSPRDTCERLEAQLRGFVPVASHLVVATTPKHDEEARKIISSTVSGFSYYVQHWLVHLDLADVFGDDQHRSFRKPWATCLLDILHAEELRTIAARHRVGGIGPRTRHTTVRDTLADVLQGREVQSAACRALRSRADAFDRASDPPIKEPVAQCA